MAEAIGCTDSFEEPAKVLANAGADESGVCTVDGDEVLLFTFRDDADRAAFVEARESEGADSFFGRASWAVQVTGSDRTRMVKERLENRG